jgi:hypothetical protein
MPELKIVHVTRSLCAQNQSRAGHSIRAGHRLEGSSSRSQLLSNASREAAYQPVSDPEMALTDHSCSPVTALHQVVNDICLAYTFGRSENYLATTYETLENDFPQILSFLNLPKDKSLKQVSVTEKNPRLSNVSLCSLGISMAAMRDEFIKNHRQVAETSSDPSMPYLALGMLVEKLTSSLHLAAIDPTAIPGRQLVSEVHKRSVKRIQFW